MSSATQPTVHWLPELAPSLEGREAALAMFEQQTGHAPAKFLSDIEARVWGFLDGDAVLLFKVPDGWTP